MLVPVMDFISMYEGIEYTYKESDLYRSDTPRIQHVIHLFKPSKETYIEVESATAAPGERRQ